jgi:hypothetical protein
MEILSTPFSNQPTVTNPLTQNQRVEGNESDAFRTSETQNTVTAADQDPAAVTTPGVVNQTNETDESGFNPDNPGGTIDITA